MSLQKFVEKLNNSNVYREFKEKHKENYLTAGFFVLDLEAGNNINQLDFYIPKEKKVAAFTFGKEISMQLMDLIVDKTPEKLDMKTKIDLDALPGILEDEMKNRSLTENIKKIIAVLQNLDGKKIWNLSCILSGMEILRAHIEDESESVLKMEKTSLMDIMKTVPAAQLMQKGAAGLALGKTGKGEKIPKAALKSELDKLNKIEEQIEKEKVILNKEMAKPVKSDKTTKKIENKVKK